jgi:acyl-CoA synthetase (AMP-forming)/AMP-acid ligase II
MRPDVWRKFQARFGVTDVMEFFNSTEGVFTLNNYSRNDHFADAVGHHGAVFRAVFKNTYIPVKLDYETGEIWRHPKTGFAQRQPYEEGGEMLVKVVDENVFKGYWNAPEATAKKYARDVFEKGDLYYRSGDALRRSSDGNWFFMDRLGDTFRWKGENCSTTEVAEALGRFPAIKEANVYGVEVPGKSIRVVEDQVLKITKQAMMVEHVALPYTSSPQIVLRSISELSWPIRKSCFPSMRSRYFCDLSRTIKHTLCTTTSRTRLNSDVRA